MNVKDDVSTNWKLFRQAWEYYVTATELNKKSKELQAGALCSVMGLECVKVMNSLTALAPVDKSDPEKILTALGNHFMPQKHLLFERVEFGFANQTEHETIDQYVVRLRQLSESCEFAGLCESLIRDRLVIGTRDSSTRDRLLRERPVPGLTRCIEALRASELSRKHKEQLKDAVSDPQNTVHAADKQGPGNKKQSRRNRGHESKQSKQEKTNARQCKFCGTNITLTIELNVQRLVRLALNVANKDTLLLSVRKRIEFQVGQPTRYITQVEHQDMQKVVSQHVSQYLTLMSLSLSLNVLELLVVSWANPLSWYLSHFTPSTALSTELNLTRGQHVVLCRIPTS